MIDQQALASALRVEGLQRIHRDLLARLRDLEIEEDPVSTLIEELSEDLTTFEIKAEAMIAELEQKINLLNAQRDGIDRSIKAHLTKRAEYKRTLILYREWKAEALAEQKTTG